MESNHIDAPARKKRVRKWHHRGFTGCSTCKKRHVKCDEAIPECGNCVKRGLACDGSQRTTTFKVYELASPVFSVAPKSSATPHIQRTKQTEHKKDDQADKGSEVARAGGDIDAESTAVSEIRTIRRPSPTPTSLDLRSISCSSSRYYSYFLNTVSTFLIVYDAPYNSNPFRYTLPSFASTSIALPQVMSALGALHLANTSVGQTRSTHLRSAMTMYGDGIRSLRETWNTPTPKFKLTDLATCLLLCIYEMMDSQTMNWKIHLAGTRGIFESIIQPLTSPNSLTTVENDNETEKPFKRFLISLMAYLDVAGAVSTNEGTIIQGQYWETHGGGWEYNLGISNSRPESTSEDIYLTELRTSWSILMGIQSDISTFGHMKRQGLPIKTQESVRKELEARLSSWHLCAPNCSAQIRCLDGITDGLENMIILQSIGCVETYQLATMIYLHKVSVSGQRVPRISPPHIQMAAARILALVKKFGKGVGQLGMQWSMYMAGLEVSDANDQEFLRQRFQEMMTYGLKNIERALAILEDEWFNKTMFEMYDWIQAPDIQSSLLLP
ncbi:hypothetical protein FQN57_004623 [Myotisia sp. PD_48]|nr:hypothetical protein FQN57_004623 [Myotisia sp. PD_48]